MVEFALILPLLMLLTFGIIEFALLLNANSNVAHSTRAGGRAAGISSVDPQMEYKAAQAAARALNVSPGSITGTPTICVGQYNPSSGPCGDHSITVPIVHPDTAGAPTWDIQVGGGAPGEIPPSAVDNWQLSDRHFGCVHGGTTDPFDKVVVHVSIDHNLLVPGMFKMFFGNNSAPALSSSAIFQLEPVPSTFCPTS